MSLPDGGSQPASFLPVHLQRSRNTTPITRRSHRRALCLTRSFPTTVESTPRGRRQVTRCEPPPTRWTPECVSLQLSAASDSQGLSVRYEVFSSATCSHSKTPRCRCLIAETVWCCRYQRLSWFVVGFIGWLRGCGEQCEADSVSQFYCLSSELMERRTARDKVLFQPGH